MKNNISTNSEIKELQKVNYEKAIQLVNLVGTELKTSVASYFNQKPVPLDMITDGLKIAITINNISLERIALSDAPNKKLKVSVLKGHNKMLNAKLKELLKAHA